MFRSSQQRNSRSKGFTVRHALQICVVLGVCIWLIYQVQDSSEKKKSHGEGAKSGSEVVKLGRKDPHPYEEESPVIDARHKVVEDEDESKYEEKTKPDNNGVEDEILRHKYEQNNNDEKSEHRQDPVDHEIEESSENAATNKESEENDNKANKESDSEIKENEDKKNKVEENQNSEIREEKGEPKKEDTRERDDMQHEENKSEVEDNQSSETSEEKSGPEKEDTREMEMDDKENEEKKSEVEDNESSETSEEKSDPEKEETRETDADSKENEESNQNRTEAKKHTEGNHEQDSEEDKEESNEPENDREGNDEIQEEVASKDRVQDRKRNSEETREEHYAGDNASSTVGFNKTEQSGKKEKNEFEVESWTNGTDVAHLDKNESVLNVTKSKSTNVTDSTVTTTNTGNGSENQAEKKNDSRKSSIAESDEQEQEHSKLSSDGVETLHSQNGTDTTSNTSEKQFETSDNSNAEGSILHNTMLKKKDSNSGAAWKQADSTLTNSSGTHERNVTNGDYNVTFGNSAQSKNASNNSTHEGMPENVLSSNSKGNKDASQEVQLTSSNPSSELKKNEPFKFGNSTDSMQSNTNSVGSANDNKDASAKQITEGASNSENNAGQNKSNSKENANDNGDDDHDGPVNAADSSIPEQKDASSKNNVDAWQIENTVTNKNEDAANKWNRQKKKKQHAGKMRHKNPKLNDQGKSGSSNH